MNKPKCFTEYQWQIYTTELQAKKGSKKLDICFDCCQVYQAKMRKEGRCEYPMKRLDKIAEYK